MSQSKRDVEQQARRMFANGVTWQGHPMIHSNYGANISLSPRYSVLRSAIAPQTDKLPRREFCKTNEQHDQFLSEPDCSIFWNHHSVPW